MKITALIDASAYSTAVCDYAGWLAARGEATLDLVHVLPTAAARQPAPNLSGSIGLGARTALLQELSELDEQQAKVAHKRGRLLVDDAKQRVLEQFGDIDVHGRLRHGDLVDTVGDLEPESDLIIIGKRGEDAHAAEGHLGSNLERVVRASHKPVLVVNRNFHPITHPLIAFDGGNSVAKAVNHLCTTRVFQGLDCTLLAVGKVRGVEEAQERLGAAGYSVTVDQRSGSPEAEITAAVSGGKHDLLIMGAYGHSRIRNLIIGSTTTEMIRTAGIPLLLFR